MTISISQELLKICKITWLMALYGFLMFSKSIISVLFLAHLGVVELAGGSFSSGFTNITGHSVIKGLGMAMEPICCQAYGAKRWAVLKQTHNTTVYLQFLALVPIIVLWLSMEPVLHLLDQDKSFTLVAKEYITYSIFDLLAQAYLHVLKNFISSQGTTKPLVISSIVSIILHLPINYLLVIVMKMGVKGVALASGLGSLNIVICLFVYLLTSNSTLKPWDKSESEASSRSQGWKPLLQSAVPSLLSVCLEWWWYEIMLLLCTRLEDPQITTSAMGILMQITGLLYVLPNSLSLSMSTRVGNELGADHPAQAQRITIIGLTLAFVLGLLASVLTLTVKDVWGHLYTNEPRILSLVSAVLPLLGLCEIGNCPQTTATGILRGSSRQNVVAFIHFASFYLIGLPIAILMSFVCKMGFIGLWIGHAAAQVSCVAMMLYTLGRTDWKDQARRARESTEAIECNAPDTEVHLLA